MFSKSNFHLVIQSLKKDPDFYRTEIQKNGEISVDLSGKPKDCFCGIIAGNPEEIKIPAVVLETICGIIAGNPEEIKIPAVVLEKFFSILPAKTGNSRLPTGNQGIFSGTYRKNRGFFVPTETSGKPARNLPAGL